MKTQSPLLKFLGILLFTAGILLGTSFFGMVTWGDLEASMFDTNMVPEEKPTSFTCPVAISPRETGTVRLLVVNSAERVVRPLIHTYISNGGVLRVTEREIRLTLDPGDAVAIEYPVNAQDAVWDQFIFVRTIQYRAYPLPSRGGACGILLLDIGKLTGQQAIALIVTLSLALSLSGVGLWVRANAPLKRRPRNAATAMAAMIVVMTGGIVSAMLGTWLFGLFLAVVIILLTLVILAEFTQGS